MRLSAAEYDPLVHSRHNGRDRTGKVGHEIKFISHKCTTHMQCIILCKVGLYVLRPTAS